MKSPTLPQVRAIVRDVLIPLGGIGLIYLQAFLPGERYGLIFAGCSMMGLPFVAYGARKLDQAAQARAEEGER